MLPPLCVKPGCDRPALPTSGACASHAAEHRRTIRRRAWTTPGDPEDLRPVCISEFCKERSDPRCGGGLFCAYHWAKQNPGIIPPPEEPGVGRYKMVVRNGTKITEHRWVMQVYLGRPLEPHENVHHINGMRDDNRLENLELWSVSQPAGQRIPDKVAWAKAILQQYEPSALA